MILEIFPFLSDTKFVLQLLFALILAILFVQSGFNKVFRWDENHAWLVEHFANSYFKNAVTPLLIVITITEVAAGVFCAVGVVALFLGTAEWAYIGAVLSLINITMLFFGQRVVKDYEGAANLVNYFILCALAVYVLGML